MKPKNIFNLPDDLTNEYSETLTEGRKFTFEKIISKGHTTPLGEWYDQSRDELVILVKGEAEILYDDLSGDFLKEGDLLLIPAHKRHRVIYTSETPECVWLAIHFDK